MPISSGSVSMTRFNVAPLGAPPDFERAAFREIAPGSEVRESIGFVPFEPEASYEVGAARFAFRVRIDRLTPDPAAVSERLRALLRIEQEEGVRVTPNKRRELKSLAEEELLVRTTPRTKIIEGVLQDRLLYLGTCANAYLGRIVQLLRSIGVIADFKTPWLDLGEGEAQSEILDLSDPVLSAHGAHFLASLLEDDEIKFEPVSGYVRLQNRFARITLSGGVLRDLLKHMEEDEVELLSAKLLARDTTFTLDALGFRISGLVLPRSRAAHWTEALDERLEGIEAIWELLDRKYDEHRRRGRRRRAGMHVVT